MKKISLLVMALIIIVSSAPLFALGVGGYFTMGGNDTYRYQPGSKYEYNSFVVGCGATIDMNLVKDNFLTYRINFGYEGLINDDLSYELLNRISILNSFGFTIVKNENFRFYAGPQIALRYQFTDETSNARFINNHFNLDAFGLGIGAMFGFDLQVANKVIISPEVGLRYEFYTGTIKNHMESFLFNYTTSSTAEGHGFEGTVTLTVLYKVDLKNSTL